jgi:tetratricopeptide (TPR) repeat protein
VPLRFALILATSLLLASTAVAQDTSPSTGHDEEARALFDAGRVAYRDGRFAAARDYFQRSYELSGRAELLYNIASAQDRLRDDAATLATFEAYLEALPDAPNRAEVEARITALRAAVGGDRPPSSAAGGPTVVWSFVTGGLALVTGALAVGFWVAANDQYAGLERGCFALGGCSDADIAASNVETSVTLTNVFLVSSLVLVAATAVVLPIELTSTSSPAPVALRIGPGSLSLSGSF